MRRLDNFTNCLTILENADFQMAETGDIYRTGIIEQFNITFKLAWKAAGCKKTQIMFYEWNEEPEMVPFWFQENQN